MLAGDRGAVPRHQEADDALGKIRDLVEHLETVRAALLLGLVARIGHGAEFDQPPIGQDPGIVAPVIAVIVPKDLLDAPADRDQLRADRAEDWRVIALPIARSDLPPPAAPPKPSTSASE